MSNRAPAISLCYAREHKTNSKESVELRYGVVPRSSIGDQPGSAGYVIWQASLSGKFDVGVLSEALVAFGFRWCKSEEQAYTYWLYSHASLSPFVDLSCEGKEVARNGNQSH